MNLRIARHTKNLKNALDFYVDIIGLEKIGGFENHNGYDGIFIGKKNLAWHLEFTTSSENPNHFFDDDDIIVFYPESKDEFENIIKKFKEKNIEILKAKNPYWNVNGFLVKDFDNQNVAISPLKIK